MSSPHDDHHVNPPRSLPVLGVPEVVTGRPVRRGRPQDEELTGRLLQGTLDLLADHGLSRLNADALAARTGAGKAGIYRRWADIIDVAVAAVDSCDLVPPAPVSGSLREDLTVFLQPLTRPPGRNELAVAALLSQARYDPRIQRALDDAVVTPLTVAVDGMLGEHTSRGHTVSDSTGGLVRSLVKALWWDHYRARQPVMQPTGVHTMVNQVLLPLLE